MKWGKWSALVLVFALGLSSAHANIPITQGEIDRIYPSSRVVVVNGDQYRMPEQKESAARITSLDQLREGMKVELTAGAAGNDGVRPLRTLDIVEEAP